MRDANWHLTVGPRAGMEALSGIPGSTGATPVQNVGAYGQEVAQTITAAQHPYGIVDHYGGHGIGTEMHQDPHVLNYGRAGRGPRLVPGLALAIEPMVTVGDPATVELEDGWTVVTKDGSRAAHFEHSVAITPEGPWVLTAEDGGVAGLAPHGVAARS